MYEAPEFSGDIRISLQDIAKANKHKNDFLKNLIFLILKIKIKGAIHVNHCRL